MILPAAARGLGLAVALTAAPAMSQATIGISADYMGYTFGDGLGAEAAQLFMLPVAVRIPISDKVSFDIVSTWAQGTIERDNTQFKLQGVTDTRVLATYQASPWAIVSFGANVPTGQVKHDAQEAIVASVLSTELLGFREATFGSGLALTSAVATAMRAGGWGIGFAGAYSVRGEFEPLAGGDELRYQPGNETRIRVGVDRNIGTNTFTAGATFRQYTSDQANGRDLFQAGNRLRFDATYAFRAGAGVWTIYGAGVLRENGDLTLSILDENSVLVGDTAIVTAKQNLISGGVIGTLSVGGGFVFRPHIDMKYQIRTEPDGRDEGSGWVLGAGGDLPIRIFGAYDFFPKARILYGSIKDPTGAGIRVMGAEFTGTIRWALGR